MLFFLKPTEQKFIFSTYKNLVFSHPTRATVSFKNPAIERFQNRNQKLHHQKSASILIKRNRAKYLFLAQSDLESVHRDFYRHFLLLDPLGLELILKAKGQGGVVHYNYKPAWSSTRLVFLFESNLRGFSASPPRSPLGWSAAEPPWTRWAMQMQKTPCTI